MVNLVNSMDFDDTVLNKQQAEQNQPQFLEGAMENNENIFWGEEEEQIWKGQLLTLIYTS